MFVLLTVTNKINNGVYNVSLGQITNEEDLLHVVSFFMRDKLGSDCIISIWNQTLKRWEKLYEWADIINNANG